MASALHDFLSRDHDRLDALLAGVLRAGATVDLATYAEFRGGLLRHISIEERVLFPELRRQRGVTPLEQQLHRDHAALAGLLVPPPGLWEIEQMITILEPHNEIEERPGGLYEIIESLAGRELDALMALVHAIPDVRMAPHVDSPLVRATIGELLAARTVA